MYHYITFGDIKVYMTWIGILLFLFVSVFSLLRYAKQYRLHSQKFLTNLPVYIILRYLFSIYTQWLIESHMIIPLSLKQLYLYISPAWYPFHLVGIVVGWLAIGMHILSWVELDMQKQKWLDALLHSICLWCIPLWIFLLLGDNFIWRSTEMWLFVTAIRSDSNLAVYGKVIPLWLFVSVWWLLCHLIMNIYTQKTKKYLGYLGYALFCFGLCRITIYQQYPRHIVSSLSWITLDIKQYILLLVSIGFLIKHLTRTSTPYQEPEDKKEVIAL
jgi:hypothetical protein